jgi:hypothetical protein
VTTRRENGVLTEAYRTVGGHRKTYGDKILFLPDRDARPGNPLNPRVEVAAA